MLIFPLMTNSAWAEAHPTGTIAVVWIFLFCGSLDVGFDYSVQQGKMGSKSKDFGFSVSIWFLTWI